MNIKEKARNSINLVLENMECCNCPLGKQCKLNLAVYEKDICSVLREEKQ